MKKIMMIAALALGSVAVAQTQNTNEAEVETIKKKVVTDDEGVQVKVKKMSTTAETDIALGKRTSYHNFNTVMEPMDINTNTVYYNEGVKYRFMPESTGYYIVKSNDRDTRIARLYPSSQKGYYIYTKDGNSSLGYFNSDGDFVVESYDLDNDGIMNYVYKIEMDKDTKQNMMKKNKMK